MPFLHLEPQDPTDISFSDAMDGEGGDSRPLSPSPDPNHIRLELILTMSFLVEGVSQMLDPGSIDVVYKSDRPKQGKHSAPPHIPDETPWTQVPGDCVDNLKPVGAVRALAAGFRTGTLCLADSANSHGLPEIGRATTHIRKFCCAIPPWTA